MGRRRRDALGKFLPSQYNLEINPYQALDINPFVEAFVAVRNQGIFDLEKGDLDFLIEPPKENILPLVLYQPNMADVGGGAAPPPTFEFPILDQHDNENLKNIPASSLAKIYGLVTEDPYTFLFEFFILYRSYDYTTNYHKLKLFLAALKEATLRWFMSRGRDTITIWMR